MAPVIIEGTLLNSQSYFSNTASPEKNSFGTAYASESPAGVHVEIAPQERILSYNSVLPANVDARKIFC